MNQQLTKLSDNYTQIMNLLDELNRKNRFNSFEKTLRVQDGILNLFDSLYYLLDDNMDISSNHNIILDMFHFGKFLNHHKLITIIHKAISLGASMQRFTFDDFMLVIGLNDKDINIALSSSKYINDEVARKIYKPFIYKTVDNLFSNEALSIDFKKELFIFLCEDENIKTANSQPLIDKYQSIFQY